MILRERMAAQIATCYAAEPLDEGLKRLASSLDPTDTDHGLETIHSALQEAFLDAATALAVREGWRLQ